MLDRRQKGKAHFTLQRRAYQDEANILLISKLIWSSELNVLTGKLSAHHAVLYCHKLAEHLGEEESENAS